MLDVFFDVQWVGSLKNGYVCDKWPKFGWYKSYILWSMGCKPSLGITLWRNLSSAREELLLELKILVYTNGISEFFGSPPVHENYDGWNGEMRPPCTFWMNDAAEKSYSSDLIRVSLSQDPLYSNVSWEVWLVIVQEKVSDKPVLFPKCLWGKRQVFEHLLGSCGSQGK